MRKILLALLTGIVPVLCGAQTREEVVVNKTAQGVGFSQLIDVSPYKSVSAQAVYSNGTPSSVVVSDGQFSITTFTVANYSALNAAPATSTLTLIDGKNSSTTGLLITINGTRYLEGVDWTKGATSTATMVSLSTAINNSWEYDTSVSSNVITITAASNGTYANAWIVTCSSLPIISTSAFSGGQAAGYLNINGTTLTEGTDWDAATSSQVTSVNIKTAINANATLATQVLASTTSLGVFVVKSLQPGINAYPVSVSNASYLTPTAYVMAEGAASAISVADDTVYKASHGMTDGLRVLYSTGVANKSITGLTFGTTYYAIRVNDNYFKVASSSMNAVGGTAMDFTALSGGCTDYRFAPLTLATQLGTGFLWQGSNDGTNFSDLTSTAISSFTYTAAGNSLWNFGEYAYKYLRVVFKEPTAGGLALLIKLFGRE